MQDDTLHALLSPQPQSHHTEKAEEATRISTPETDHSDPVLLSSVDKPNRPPVPDWFRFPKLRWSVCHIRELLPTKTISRGGDTPSTLTYSLDANIDNLSFTPLLSEQTMTWEAALEANYTDGVIVLHKGSVVYQYFSGHLSETGQHAAMSMTKSIVGLLAQILIAEGKLDESAPVSSVVPELAQCGFGDATVRQVMDMTTGIDFNENYADPKADIWRYSQAVSPQQKPEGDQGPNGYYDFLRTLRKSREHGVAFSYKTIDADALGWIISRVSGQPLEQLISERLWAPLGASQDAHITVDAKGTAFAGGGINAGLQDLARLGQLLLNGGQWQGRQLFPASVVARIQQGGDPAQLAAAGYPTLPGASYNGMWWLLNNSGGAFAARGVHGQLLYIHPQAQMVIARFASHPTAANAANDPTTLPACQAVADYLMQVDP